MRRLSDLDGRLGEVGLLRVVELDAHREARRLARLERLGLGLGLGLGLALGLGLGLGLGLTCSVVALMSSARYTAISLIRSDAAKG